MSIRDKIYFASDFHLGIADYALSRQREDRIVSWLDSIKFDASELFLMGDVFDFWFEYRYVVPKGYIRFLGKLAELSDMGVKITMFKGNHDMWMFGYLAQELGVKIISDELVMDRGGKSFYLHHGDGLGPGDLKYKLLKKIFRSKVCQRLFSLVHPFIGFGIARSWSHSSRLASLKKEDFLGEQQEWLMIHSREVLTRKHYDFFIYGHRHLPMDRKLNDNSRYINLGEWINYFSYAVFDGDDVRLMYFQQDETADRGRQT